MTDPTGASPPDTRIHLDAASGEPLHPAAREAWSAALDAGWADPARLHHDGRNARLLLDNARAAVAECLGVRPDEVSFTSSGTDAIHRGLLGLLERAGGAPGRVLYSAVEHSSVLQAAAWWADRSRGTAEPLAVDSSGRVDVAGLADAVGSGSPGDPVRAVAVQSANHEVGTVQPLEAVYDACGDVPVLVDLAASAGRQDVPAGWSVAAASAHKWGGPAGIGVLCVRKGVRWRPAYPVDDRGDPRVSGFENVPAALAAAAALQARTADRAEVAARQHRLVERIRRRVAAEIPDVDVVGDPDDRLPHVVTFSCLYVEGEALVTELDRLGFEVASGSACTASTLVPSHVLAAMGALTHGNVRVSLPHDVTDADVDAFLDVLPGVVARLRP